MDEEFIKKKKKFDRKKDRMRRRMVDDEKPNGSPNEKDPLKG
jgi:hypothetical protein